MNERPGNTASNTDRHAEDERKILSESIPEDTGKIENLPDETDLPKDEATRPVDVPISEKQGESIMDAANDPEEEESEAEGSNQSAGEMTPEVTVSQPASDTYPVEEAASNATIRRVRSEKSDTAESVQKDKGLLYSFLDTLRFVSLGLIIGILLVVFVVQRNDVYGSSMEPNLHQNDAVFVEMISKYFAEYDRGAIVTIDANGMPGYDRKEKIIKRVIGRPGDTVLIKDGSVYINGVLLAESYIPQGVPTNMTAEGTANGYDNVTLGKGEYYCMGDNRGASLDSRVLGPIPDSRIKAHVIAKIFPFDEMRLY